MGSRLRHFLYDLGRKRMELNIIGHDIADRFRSGVFLLHVKILQYDFSDDVLLFRCQRKARRGRDGWRGSGLRVDISARCA